MSRTYTDFFKHSLLTGAINFDSDTFAVILCDGSPGSEDTVEQEADLSNVAAGSKTSVTVTRSGVNIALTSGSMGVLSNYPLTNYSVFLNETKDIVCWWEDGVGLDTNGTSEVLYSGSGQYIFTI